jgi:hypothetical protein
MIKLVSRHTFPPVDLAAAAVTTAGILEVVDGRGRVVELVAGIVVGFSKVVDTFVGSGAGVVVGTGTGIGVVGAGATVVVPSRPPGRVGMAYGGSKRPKWPQALHGHAQDLIALGAKRMGSQRELGIFVAMTSAGRA